MSVISKPNAVPMPASLQEPLSATCLLAAMTEFWLISAPGEKTCQQSWDKMMMATTHTTNLSTNNKFNIPDLKVTTRTYPHAPNLARKHSGPKYLAMVQCFVLCAVSVSINCWYCFNFCSQVGTLDVLVGLSDELTKLDTFVER
jgi:hypothetical protein